MDLQKYKNHLFSNMKKQLSAWFELNLLSSVPKNEVYRFLHSVKGTSGTIELGGLMQVTEELLSKLENKSPVVWSKSELKNFLYPLIEFTYKYENSSELATLSETEYHASAPLIQVIDDDVSMLILLKDVLEENGWMVIAHTNPEKAVKQYFEMKPDCLILDIQLPQKNGFQILQEIQEHNGKHFIPTIMISILSDKETRIKAYKNGADDFMKKPIEIDEFVAKISRHLQRKKLFDKSVLMDELTQVYNRKFLKENLRRYFNEFKRTRQQFTISILDIDFFKKINDTYGHLMGDQVLKEFAQYIQRNIRTIDTVYRYGGEEFVIIFPKTTSEQVKKRLNELLGGFAQIKFSHKDQDFSVTFSAGIYTIESEFITIDDALKEADHSLYEAKRNGRARVECLQRMSSPFEKGIINVSIIDDDIIVRTLLAQMMESVMINQYELNIQIFENGPDFLKSAHAKEDTDHFLILDGMMPEMDGIEILQQIKQGKNAHNYKVLMLTGRKSKEEIEHALRLGADDYVTKPFNITELQARIERILNAINS